LVAETADDTTIGQEKKNRELENVVGNLLVADYQVDRIKQRIIDKITSWHDAKSINDNRSIFVFWSNEKCYRVLLEVESQQGEGTSKDSNSFTELGFGLD
jgi:predicted transcriptional regulator